jgi:UDP-N-acetylglucosamine 2-epimerase (non-hydrolysing)
VVVERRPDWVVVVGDVNSTIACALVAVKLETKVAHVEAGLRSYDRTMPEEINRLLTDSISDLLLASEPGAVENLRREGLDGEKVQFVGNVMIDTLMKHRARADESRILSELGVSRGGYVVVTLHRPSNADRPEALSEILGAFEVIAGEVDIVFPMHPRTKKNLAQFGLADRAARIHRLKIVEPLGYLDYLKLMADSRAVLTDSGGVQEETTILGVPCLTMRPTTERPITISHGTNRLVPVGPGGYCSMDAILQASRDAMSGSRKAGGHPPLWDGSAAKRIAACLLKASCAG